MFLADTPMRAYDNHLTTVTLMLYDGRKDYIRRRQPKRVSLPQIGVVGWLAVLFVSAAVLCGAIKHGNPNETNESFKQVFSWG
jgi:hypothetical protein